MSRVIDTAQWRRQQCERLDARYPGWQSWHDGRQWHARRRGSFRDDGSPRGPRYAVSAPGLHEFRVLLAIEAGVSVPAGQAR